MTAVKAEHIEGNRNQRKTTIDDLPVCSSSNAAALELVFTAGGEIRGGTALESPLPWPTSHEFKMERREVNVVQGNYALVGGHYWNVRGGGAVEIVRADAPSLNGCKLMT